MAEAYGPALTWERDYMDDLLYFDAVAEWLKGHVCFDSGRIFATGQSSGAFFSHTLGCHRAGVLRALAPHAGGKRDFAGCKGPVAAWIAHGTMNTTLLQTNKDARDHCWHVVHDLEANGFFIDLALASRLALREGVLLWVGEETCRADRRLFAKENRRPVATPDGAGSYLIAGHVIHFDLEWDRGTASLIRLQKKVRTTIRYFKDIRNAERLHILFVLSRASREEALRPIIQAALDATQALDLSWAIGGLFITAGGILLSYWA